MADSSRKLIGQNIRGFIVQIQDNDGQIQGTGFAVQRNPGLIVTCRHVVEEVNGICELDALVKVYFPQITHGKKEDKRFIAKVIRQLEQYDDDVVVLQLISDKEGEEQSILLPSAVEVAVLGDASQSELHGFRSLGFPDRDKYNSTWIDGTISGHIFRPEGTNSYGEPIELQANRLAPGVSGSPVWDIERNLVVGVISEIYEPADGSPATDGYGVDGVVMSIAPLDLPMYPDYEYPRTESLSVDKQIKATAEEFAPTRNFPLEVMYKPTQPPELPEWAGREEFLSKLDKDYADTGVHITGLIGFGGEGKSSIAYRWLTKNALTGNNQPDAAFWWSFYENRSFESMVEALIEYLYGKPNLEHIKGTGNRVNYIGAMALTRTLVLVLDGFEVMQEESGDKYGTLANKDFLRLIELFAQTRTSYCLVTSRVPLMDFLNHSAYVQRDVARLTDADGRQLLENLSITGDDETLDRIVKDWDGHALTISLVGSYLREQEISAKNYSANLFPEAIEWEEGQIERYKKVSRVLVRYDEKLTLADKAFLKLFSVFRLPVSETAFDKVFRADTGSSLNSELHGLDDSQFAKLVEDLQMRRLIKKGADTYSAHPLVQRHYRKAFEEAGKEDMQAVHKAAAGHYQETNDEPGRNPTLDDLKPYIEVVHHLCSAGTYDEAKSVQWENIDQGESYVLMYQLGAYETELNLTIEYFPDNDLTQKPGLSSNSDTRLIYQIVGFCLQNLGRLKEVIAFHERANIITTEMGDHANSSRNYRNIAQLSMYLGELVQMQMAYEKALSVSRQVDDERDRKGYEKNYTSDLAWANHVQGKFLNARDYFKSAEILENEIDPDRQYLYGIRGINHADHLQRVGNTGYAKRVTKANLEICKKGGWINHISQCHRILGDLESDADNHDTAREHYEHAIAIAGQIDDVHVKIEAYLARGLWFAKHMKNAEKAFADLDLALSMALKGGYRILEADIRVALAWAHKLNGDDSKMKQEAFIAKGMSEEMGYHWGQVDAKEVLEA